MPDARWLAVIGAGVLLFGGCAAQPGRSVVAGLDPVATGSVAPSPVAAPLRAAALPDGDTSNVIDLTASDDDAAARPPQPGRIAAARGGSIMVETPAEQAANRRNYAAMLKSVDRPKVDFLNTGSVPQTTQP